MIAITLVVWMAAGATPQAATNPNPNTSSVEPAVAEAQAAVAKAFSKAELDKFIADYPGFMEKVRAANKQEALSLMVRRAPQNLAGEPEIQAAAKGAGWDPPRFIYILRNVVHGVKAQLTGGMGDERLAMLRRKRAEAAEAQDAALVERLDRDIVEHAESVKTTHAIPRSELVLMMRRQSELKAVMEKTLRLTPRRLPNRSANP